MPIPFAQLRKALEEYPTESMLSEFNVEYCVLHISGIIGDFETGAVLVECEDGLYAIPYNQCDSERGYEQLILDAAVLVEGELSRAMLDRMQRKYDELARWMSRVSQKVTESAQRE